MKMLLYSCKTKPYLYKQTVGNSFTLFLTEKKLDTLKHSNGKVVAEGDYEVEEIEYEYSWKGYENIDYFTNKLTRKKLEKQSCLTNEELKHYLKLKPLCSVKGKIGYAIHIKNLKVFDEPKELSDYYTFDSKQHININYCKPIIKAPQNMMYCWSTWQDSYVISNRYFYENILISIQPQWLSKILNGEKTIEIRKKVLKGMLKK